MSEEKKGWGCSTIALVFLGLIILGAIIQGPKKTDKPVNTPSVQAPQSKPSTSTEPAKIETPMPPKELIQLAKRDLSEKSDSWPFGDYPQAIRWLNKISKDAPEYPEAQRLLKQCYNIKKKTEVADRKKAEDENKAKRIIYGPILENAFLDKGYDIFCEDFREEGYHSSD